MSARSRKAEPMRLPPPEEEDWSMSEAEEDWEEMSDEEELEVGEEEGIEEAEEEPSSLPQSASPISPPTLPPKRSKAAAVTAAPKPTRRWDATSKTTAPRKASSRAAAASGRNSETAAAIGGLRLGPHEPVATRELRNRIFPTLYAIFQQSRGKHQELKIKNRTLRSLTRSCLYHKSEDQLQRTLEDAEALFHKYCSTTLNS
ncbi:33K [simian adenovirus 55]|uniref:33K n=1 Tax=simian adenovirus 55 TaxID=2848082 RepID=A0A1L3INY1_9ADEN|nr:33K [Simian mastadenovirus WIV19]APG53808.1 33K [Simian mastadenovirus WIV19]